MSIHGVNNPLLGNLGTIGRPNGAQGTGAARPGQTGGLPPSPLRPGLARPAAPPASPAALRPQQSLAAPAASLPAEAPAGTDPELWGVLTSEERAFFAKAAASGPLTYGRVAAAINPVPAGAPAVRGARLDVRA